MLFTPGVYTWCLHASAALRQFVDWGDFFCCDSPDINNKCAVERVVFYSASYCADEHLIILHKKVEKYDLYNMSTPSAEAAKAAAEAKADIAAYESASVDDADAGAGASAAAHTAAGAGVSAAAHTAAGARTSASVAGAFSPCGCDLLRYAPAALIPEVKCAELFDAGFRKGREDWSRTMNCRAVHTSIRRFPRGALHRYQAASEREAYEAGYDAGRDVRTYDHSHRHLMRGMIDDMSGFRYHSDQPQLHIDEQIIQWMISFGNHPDMDSDTIRRVCADVLGDQYSLVQPHHGSTVEFIRKTFASYLTVACFTHTCNSRWGCSRVEKFDVECLYLHYICKKLTMRDMYLPVLPHYITHQVMEDNVMLTRAALHKYIQYMPIVLRTLVRDQSKKHLHDCAYVMLLLAQSAINLCNGGYYDYMQCTNDGRQLHRRYMYMYPRYGLSASWNYYVAQPMTNEYAEIRYVD